MTQYPRASRNAPGALGVVPTVASCALPRGAMRACLMWPDGSSRQAFRLRTPFALGSHATGVARGTGTRSLSTRLEAAGMPTPAPVLKSCLRNDYILYHTPYFRVAAYQMRHQQSRFWSFEPDMTVVKHGDNLLLH